MPNHRRNDSKTHSIALSGLLFALAMALSFVEGTLVLPGLLPETPGNWSLPYLLPIIIFT